MLKRQITFEDYWTGETVTKTFYFHLSKPEVAKLQLDTEAEKLSMIVTEFEKIILAAYGIKGPDGEFEKSDEIRRKFASSPAYEVLFDELSEDESGNAVKEFLKGVLPKGMSVQVDDAVVKAKELAEPGTVHSIKE